MTRKTLAQLQERWTALNDLAAEVTRDERRLSTPLPMDDLLISHAKTSQVQLVSPLTVGTLLAEILSEIDGVEMAIESARREAHPGEDAPDPFADWQFRYGHHPRFDEGQPGLS